LLLKTVLMETEWVLRGLGFERLRIVESLAGLLGLPNAFCEEMSSVSEAIEWIRKGMDFADAIHLASARAALIFVTFDSQARQACER
jgi:predicted nucleic acid-binding protein